jgi:ABC-2 type transport system ATP-binding protein
MIFLEHATKLYGSVIGVNDLTLSLEQGAYGLIGPNGSGKSTLLNLLTGQLWPTLGAVRTLGGDPCNNPDVLRRLGVCPEMDVLYGNVSGVDWVTYLLRLHGFGLREAKARAEQTLEKLGMAHAMRRRMGTYSRGMRQRTKLAQALAHDPEVLILDEPLNGLDPVGRHEITVLLRKWIERGRGLLMASHILHEVEAVTQSFLLICGGRLLASGSAEEVHTLLAEIPNEIQIRSSDPSALARLLVEERVVESVRFVDSDALLVSTRCPAAIYSGLPGWIAGTGLEVRELRSTDESLHALFNSLMRIHRGRE